jgi:hypothetical protein
MHVNEQVHVPIALPLWNDNKFDGPQELHGLYLYVNGPF